MAVATNSSAVRLFDSSRNSSGGCQFLSGHAGIIIALDTSPDGRFLATASKDRTVRIWNLKTLEVACECIGHTDAVGAVAFHSRRAPGAAGGFLITGSADRTIKLWSIPSALGSGNGQNIAPKRCSAEFTQLAHQKDINAVAVSPNDRLFATASQDRTLKLWQTDSCTVVGTCKGHKRGVWSVAFSPVDKVVASASGDASLKLWSVSDCSCLRTFEGHDASVLKVGSYATAITSGCNKCTSARALVYWPDVKIRHKITYQLPALPTPAMCRFKLTTIL